GLLVAIEARQAEPRLFDAKLILALDAAWVIGSLVLLAAAPQAFTLWGRLVVADVAAIVALIALAEAAGIGALRRAGALVAACNALAPLKRKRRPWLPGLPLEGFDVSSDPQGITPDGDGACRGRGGPRRTGRESPARARLWQ